MSLEGAIGRFMNSFTTFVGTPSRSTIAYVHTISMSKKKVRPGVEVVNWKIRSGRTGVTVEDVLIGESIILLISSIYSAWTALRIRIPIRIYAYA
jgi:hypothetical protein